MGDEMSKGLTLQVLYNISRVSNETGDPTQQDTPTLLDPGIDIDPNWNRMRNDPTGHTGTSALGLLYSLETESHKIERTIRTLQYQPSQHHTTQVLGMKILQALTPKGFSLDERSREIQDLKWSHPISGTHFDILPDPVAVFIKLTYWHCLKATGHTLEGTFLVPVSANIIELIQMLLWKHPYVAMKSYHKGMAAYNETRDTRLPIPLCTTIRALGLTTQKSRIHLLLPD